MITLHSSKLATRQLLSAIYRIVSYRNVTLSNGFVQF